MFQGKIPSTTPSGFATLGAAEPPPVLVGTYTGAYPDKEENIPRHTILSTFREQRHIKRFGQQNDNQCWWYGNGAQAREHLFRHNRTRKNEQRVLWKAVGRETG
jgi:hypothetical protein